MCKCELTPFYVGKITLDKVPISRSDKSTNDDVPLQMFKLFPVVVIERLKPIFNECFEGDILLAELMKSRIIPVNESGEGTN